MAGWTLRSWGAPWRLGARPTAKPGAKSSDEPLQPGGGAKGVAYFEALRIKENFTALLRRLEYEQRSGSLVEISLAQRVVFDLCREQRDAWLSWSAKVAPFLAVEYGIADLERLAASLTAHVHTQLATSESPNRASKPAKYEQIAQTGRRGWTPPPRLSLPEWADRYRKLARSAGSLTSAWHTSTVEAARGPMLAVTEPGVHAITAMVCTQLRKTALLENIVGYHAHLDPCPVLLLQPKDEATLQFSKERLTPLIRATRQPSNWQKRPWGISAANAPRRFHADG